MERCLDVLDEVDWVTIEGVGEVNHILVFCFQEIIHSVVLAMY
jgi:hypothetical protein